MERIILETRRKRDIVKKMHESFVNISTIEDLFNWLKEMKNRKENGDFAMTIMGNSEDGKKIKQVGTGVMKDGLNEHGVLEASVLTRFCQLHKRTIEETYTEVLFKRVLPSPTDDGDDYDSDDSDVVMEVELSYLEEFEAISKLSLCLGIDYLECFMRFLYRRVEDKIGKIKKLGQIKFWVQEYVHPLLKLCIKEEKLIQLWLKRILFYIYDVLGNTLIENLFDIIVNYPDSLPMFYDLKECLIHTQLQEKMVEILRKATKSRLLLAGAHTNDIIIQYTNAIRGLTILDPTGVSLEIFSQDMNEYLRSRKDAIKYFVNNIIDQETDLYDELVNPDSVHIDNFGEREEWIPKPLYPDPSISLSKKKPSIITMFLHVFQNVESFVKEYQKTLSQQLYEAEDFDTSPSRILELLKLRFGDSNLQKCEIMLRDIADSERIWRNISPHLKSSQNFSNISVSDSLTVQTKILSREFWPAIEIEKCQPHPLIYNYLKQYGETFNKLKTPRTLTFHPVLGTISMDIEINNQTVDINCNPIEASIILYFAEKSELNVEELCKEMNCSAEIIQKHIKFWLQKQLIRKTGPNSFALSSNFDVSTQNNDDGMEETILEQDNQTQVIEYIDNFVTAMLTVQPSSLDTIHQTMSMMPNFDMSITELNKYILCRSKFTYDSMTQMFSLSKN